MKKKFKGGIIAIALAGIMTFQTVPMNLLSAFAEEIADAFVKEEGTEQEFYRGNMVDKDNIGTSYIIQENVENRTETTKEFLMSDNTIMVQQFVEPIHYYEDGEYKEIDNTLKETQENGETVYKNNGNTFKVKFKQDDKGNKHSVEIEEEGASLTIGYKVKKEKKSKVKVKNKEKGKNEDYSQDKHTRPQNNKGLSGKITYESVEDNTDFVYEVKNNTINEKIVIAKEQKDYVYTFELQSSNLQFKQAEDGSIYAHNPSGNTKFVMPVPYMVDANGEYSDAVSYELKESGGKAEIVITAEESWINEEAEFPVAISPEIKSAGDQNFSFTNVYENGKTVTNADKLYIGRKNGAEKSDVFLNFRLPSVAPYYQLLGASVEFEYATAGMSLLGGKDLNYNLYVAESTKDLSTVTYEDKPNQVQVLNGISRESQHSEKILSYESDIINPHNLEENTITMGIETAAETSKDGYIALAASTETMSAVYWYQRVIGLDDDYSMEQTDVEGAKTYVNNATGQLTAVFDLVSVNTLSDMPFEVSLIYNDYYHDMLQDMNPNLLPIVGRNFKLNFQQMMIWCENGYKFIDADGSISRFKQVNNNLYYSAEKELYYNPNYSSQAELMCDSLGNRMLFRDQKLSEIYSQNNPDERIKIIYNDVRPNRIERVEYYAQATALPKHTVTFGYDSENKIVSVTTNLGMKKSLSYDDEGNLISIKDQTGLTNPTLSQGVELMELAYCRWRVDSDPRGMLNYIINNQREGIIFDRNADDTVYQIRNMGMSGISELITRCRSSVLFERNGIHTRIFHYENEIMTGSRTVAFNNAKKVISEWQQDANGLVTIQATTNWRSTEGLTTDYVEEQFSYYHRAVDTNGYGLGAGGNSSTPITSKQLEVSDHANYRFAVIFQVGVSEFEEDLSTPIALDVKITDSSTGNTIEENIRLSQGGRTYIFVPCGYYENGALVEIRNRGTKDVSISCFNYALLNSAKIYHTYKSDVQAHKVTRAETNLRSGLYDDVTYDEKGRISQECVKRIETGDVTETTAYTYYDNANNSAIQKGKIQTAVTTKGEEETARTEYAYEGTWVNYQETITTTKDTTLRTYSKNEINRNTGTVTQTDENGIVTTARYATTNGDLRLVESTYADARETYSYNNLGQLTEVNVYAQTGGAALFSQTNNYDAKGMYLGTSYGGTQYTYSYDESGYITSIGKDDAENPLLEYRYGLSSGTVGSNRMTYKKYANDNEEHYTYSTSYIGGSTVNKTQVEHKNTASGTTIGTYVYNYNTNGAMTSQSYKSNGYTQLTYDYGELDNLDEQTLTITGLEFYFQYTQNYDKLNNRPKKAQIYSLIGCQTTNSNAIWYSYDEKGRLSGLSYDSYDVEYSYDEMGRLTGRTIPYDYYSYYEDKANEQYVYTTYTQNGTTYTTNLLSCIDDQTNENNDRTSAYDENGYVTGISYNGNNYAYTYDSAGRLTSESKNDVEQATYAYYDSNNIKKQGLTYAAGVLTSVDGEPIAYDAMGNPTTYKGNSFTWTQGRKLTSGSMNGKSFAYSYDGNGMRYEKTVNGTTTSYYYNGSQLLMESKNGERIYYIYGVTGIEGLIMHNNYQSAYYSFDKNTLGDIVAIRDSNGQIVAKYDYNAWGEVTVMDGNGYTNTLSSFIGNINPFRYRGYYYDTETGFYYLQTRYYDPTICRFINADNYELVGQLSVGELNMYAYCGNNPIMYTDPTGEFGILAGLIIGAIIGAGIGFGKTVYSDYTDDGEIFNGSVGFVEYAGATVTGAALGGAVGGIIGAGGIYLAGATTSTFGKLTTDLFAYSLSGAPIGAIEDYALAFAFGGLTANVGKGAKKALDILLRPALNQGVGIGLGNQSSFKIEKYFYDVATRGLTSGVNSPWKSFYRGGFKAYWYALTH